MGKARISWDGGGDDFLRRCHEKLSAPQIAEMLGVSADCVRRRLKRLGLGARHFGSGLQKPWTPEETIQLRKFRAEGRTVKFIARALGRTQGSVKGRLRLLAERGNPARSPL